MALLEPTPGRQRGRDLGCVVDRMGEGLELGLPRVGGGGLLTRGVAPATAATN